MRTEFIPPRAEQVAAPPLWRAGLGWWFASGLALIVWLLMLFNTPKLVLTYTPEQLGTIIGQGQARGFYKPESDAAANRYSWTAERAVLQFDFAGHKPLVLQVSLRSAAVAGGPAGPVRVLANDVEIGQFIPDPTNSEFQTFSLKFTPPPTADQQLKLELLSEAFKPTGEPRTLGTMVKTITLDKSEAWDTVAKRIWIFYAWAVLVILAASLKLGSSRRFNLAGTFAAGAVTVSACLIFGLLFSLGVLERETYRLWLVGAAYLVVFSVTLVLQRPAKFYQRFLVWLRPRLSQLNSHFEPALKRLLPNPLAWILVTCVVASLAIYSQLQFDSSLYLLDVNIYLEAGRKITQGQNAYQPFIIGTSFFYPPPALLFFAPLSNLPLEVAHWVWLSLGGLSYLLSLELLRQTFRFSRWFFLPALLYLPLWETLSVGQINTVVLLGLSLLCWGYRVRVLPVTNGAKSGWLSEAGAALATLLKMTPALLLIPALLARQWSRLGRLLAIFGLISLLPIIFWGFAPWLDFSKVLPNLFLTGSSSRSYSLAPTIDWVLTGLHDGEQSATAVTLSRLVALGLIGGWLWLAVSFRKTGGMGLLAAGVVVLTISSSIVWYHHFVFLLIPILYLLGTKQTANVLAGVLALSLVQADRLAQKLWTIPPLLSTAACLLLFSWLIFQLVKKVKKVKKRSLPELEDLENAVSQ